MSTYMMVLPMKIPMMCGGSESLGLKAPNKSIASRPWTMDLHRKCHHIILYTYVFTTSRTTTNLRYGFEVLHVTPEPLRGAQDRAMPVSFFSMQSIPGYTNTNSGMRRKRKKGEREKERKVSYGVEETQMKYSLWQLLGLI
uniref:Uncharacterized protein n=1 Tax=Cacopsylla melanoneura TaxID=428564 RepID=A0A8D9FFM4_9HEMI